MSCIVDWPAVRSCAEKRPVRPSHFSSGSKSPPRLNPNAIFVGPFARRHDGEITRRDGVGVCFSRADTQRNPCCRSAVLRKLRNARTPSTPGATRNSSRKIDGEGRGTLSGRRCSRPASPAPSSARAFFTRPGPCSLLLHAFSVLAPSTSAFLIRGYRLAAFRDG